jgi:hypothetical protein
LKKADLVRWGKYFDARNQGVGVEQAARKARLSASTAYRFERGDQGSGGLEAAAVLGVSTVGGRVVAQPLLPEAVRALEDFAFFRLRYFGRRSTAWQERAAYEILRLLESGDREYVVMNEPPGSGKSTLFTHDIPCWLVARDRTIRIQVGSRTERQARMYVGRIKRSLERDAPLRADADSLARGIAFDAEACLQDDFGAFKPEGRTDLWRAEALVVRQLSGVALDDKEPTVSAWGQDSGFLGGRFDVVIWDDLVDRKNTKSAESKDTLREWWDAEAETRLEPGGLLLLQGQRIAHDDLYRYCLDKKTIDELPKYRHVVFKAHDEDLCTGEHEDVAPWPDGCLLDPHRLPWKHLETLKHNNPRSFEVMYQQQDGDVVGGLVDPVWITGGVDAEGYPAPGCLDKDRGLLDPPEHLLDGQGWSFVTVDPSPTEWWGVIWWLYDPESGNRYIVDLHRKRMNPEQFLSLDLDFFEWSGLMNDLWERSIELNIPLSHVIVEVNAAQRWLLSQPHVQKWMAMTGVAFVPHTTSINKQDPKYGLESIGDLFRQGRVRIPWGDVVSRNRTQFLIDEATRYPDHETTDLIMSTWFGKLAVENHYTPRREGLYRMSRPNWLAYRERGLVGAW